MSFPNSFFSSQEESVRKNIRYWTQDASCLREHINVDSFFDPEDSNLKKLSRSICASCPVQKQCLYTALILQEDHGLWGGLTPKQRRIFLKRILPISRRNGIDVSSSNKDIADFIFNNCSYQEAFDVLD